MMRVANLVHLLRQRAESSPAATAFVFLKDGEDDRIEISYAELDRVAKRIAASLRAECAVGSRALLLFPSGIDFIAALFGCFYAGLVAVPAYPPEPLRWTTSVRRVRAIAADSQCSAILHSSKGLREQLSQELPELAEPVWIDIDGSAPSPGECADESASSDTIALLQYTSGSTASPKGVMLSHGNVLENQALIQAALRVDHGSVGVGWLPLYHDMGLIGNVLGSIYAGIPCVLMSPLHFLQRPARWLEAITRYRGSHSGGPNFAYELCVQKITEEQQSGLDLSDWQCAFNGAEPIREQTLRRFAQRFAANGFRAEAFHVCYGLAESTLFVTGRTGTPQARWLERDSYQRGDARVKALQEPGCLPVVGCGEPRGSTRLEVVDPQTRQVRGARQVGEIWVAGPSVAQGYWNAPDVSRDAFGACLASGEGPFLRTGDLGFVDEGELFVCGRLKDVIVVRGRKIHPEDVELTAQQASPVLRPGSIAAFRVEHDGTDAVALVAAVDGRAAQSDPELFAKIRSAITEAHQVQLQAILLVRPGDFPRTSSGKVQRQACRQTFESGGFHPVGEWQPAVASARHTNPLV
jgi:acyl-CoA synthetase (AMP-forming)/AMP-acid ligase II